MRCLAVLGAVALLAAGCAAGSAAAVPASGPATAQQLDSFASCMRGHGIPEFYFSTAGSNFSPGPTQTYIKIGGYVASADTSLPKFTAAQHACQSRLPVPAPLTSAELEQELSQQVRRAACIRAHGFPGYPDPAIQNGHVSQPAPPSSIDQRSPRFQAAVKACH